MDGAGVPGPDELRVRRYQPGDEAGINAGFNRVFGSNRTLEEWFWKFPERPNGRWITVVTDPAGIIAAHFAAVAMPMQVPGGSLLAGQGADAYCLPEFRARGVYGRAVEHFFGHCAGPGAIGFFFGFAGSRNAEVLAKYHRFLRVGEAPLWRRLERPRRGWLPLGHEVSAEFDGAAADTLWNRVRRRYPWAGIRDGAWWRQRFGSRPGVEYRHFSAWRRGIPRAWAVVRRDGGRTFLADWLWDGEDERAVAALDREVVRCSPARPDRVQEQWLAGDPLLAAVLERRGWAPAPLDAPNYLVVRLCGRETPPVREVGDFYLTMGDADLV